MTTSVSREQRHTRQVYALIPMGETIGRWTVVGAPIRVWRDRCYPCICVCGVAVTITRSRLMRPGSGCRRCAYIDRGLRHRKPGTIIRNIIRAYRRGATSRGLAFELSASDVERIALRPCHYCGAPPSNQKKIPTGTLRYSGIDRVDNAVGYTRMNVVPCCRRCNESKGKRTAFEFIAWATAIATRAAQ